MDKVYDYIIVGGGIVGISTAWQLKQRRPDASVIVIEKEASLASHQTGHNSGVIHAGVYYAPGSLKATLCKAGEKATKAFCREHQIPFEQCGKLLVATNTAELERMQALYERCLENGIEVELLNQQQLQQQEPNIIGLGAILVTATGIVDYTTITNKMAELFVTLGGEITKRTEVTALEETSGSVVVQCISDGQPFQLKGWFLICCAGLMADRLTQMMNIDTDFRIILPGRILPLSAAAQPDRKPLDISYS